MNWLTDITKNEFSSMKLPLKEILEDSLYYPASGIDGSPIRNWGLGVNSFVYVDTYYAKENYQNIITNEPPKGYEIFSTREISKVDLVPNGYSPKPNVTISDQDIKTYLESLKMSEAHPSNAFGQWTIFQRKSDFSQEHGPDRFSLLHIRGEGVATYQAVYIGNNYIPKIIAILRPGTGFGGNFSFFESFLFETLKTHPRGMPEQLLYWHFRSSTDPLETPWTHSYEKLIYGPVSKGDDIGFQMSLFEKKKIVK